MEAPRGARAMVKNGGEDEEDDDSDDSGGAELLLRLGVALARGNRNDDAAVALRKAIMMADDNSVSFEAEENFLVVVNRLFQPIDAFMMFRNRDLISAVESAMKSIAPKNVLDIGSGACAAVASMLAAKQGAQRVLLYETLKVRAEAVEDIVKANGLQKQIRVVKQDFLLQPKAAAPQRANPADTLIIDVCGSLGHDLFNSELVPTVLHAKQGQFLSADVRVVPAVVHLVFVVVESVSIQELEEVRQPVDGYDLSAFNRFSRHTRTIQLSSLPHRPLCNPVRIASIDLQAIARGDSDGGGVGKKFVHQLELTQSGDAHGLVYWYEVEPEPGRRVSLGPEVGAAGSEMVWILGQGGQPPKLEVGVGATVSVSVSDDGSLDVSLVPGDGGGSAGGTEEDTAKEEEEGEEEEGEDPFTQCRGIPLYHFSMINDLHRAEAYSLAIKAALGDLEDASSARVLDVGCGSGLLSLMAVGHGAGEVHGCDKAPGMAAVARRVVQDNKMGDRISIHDKLSTHLSVGSASPTEDTGAAGSQAQNGGGGGGAGGEKVVPRCDMADKADLLISETFGDDPFSESFLPSLAHARQHLLHPHARVVPEALVVYAVALESQELLELNAVEGGGPLLETFGLDLSAWACFSRRRWSCRLPDHAVTELTPAFEAFTVDWTNSDTPKSDGVDEKMEGGVPLEGGRRVEVEVVREGCVEAIAAWYTLELHRGAGVSMSTDPTSEAMQGRHWRQAVYFLPVAQRRRVKPGETLALLASFRRDRLSFRLL